MVVFSHKAYRGYLYATTKEVQLRMITWLMSELAAEYLLLALFSR